MGYKLCPECGRQLSGNAVLCIGCGALLTGIRETESIPDKVPGPAMPDTKSCIQCGRILSSEEPFCKSCGVMQDGSNLNMDKKQPDKSEEHVLQAHPHSNGKNKKRSGGRHKKPQRKAKKSKRAKWPWFLVFTLLVACFAAGLFLSNPDNRNWLLGLFGAAEVESKADVSELAQRNIDIYDLYGKDIDDVTEDLGFPLSIQEKTDDEEGNLTEYDYGLFMLEVNQAGKVRSAHVNYLSLEDKASVLTYGMDGTVTQSELTGQLGTPDSGDESSGKLYYYPEDTVVVRYTFNEQEMTYAVVYYDENVNISDTGQTYENVVEITEWLGRYISAVESLLGSSRNLGGNAYGGHTYVVDGLTLDTNELEVICRIEISYPEHTSNNKLLVSNLFYGDDKTLMLAVMGGNAEQSGNSYTFMKSGIQLVYLLDLNDKIQAAIAESID